MSLIVKKQDGKGPQTWELVPEACPHLTLQANIGKNKGKADGKIPPTPPLTCRTPLPLPKTLWEGGQQEDSAQDSLSQQNK